MGQQLTKNNNKEIIKSDILSIKDAKRTLERAELLDNYVTYCKNSWSNKKARRDFLYDVAPVPSHQVTQIDKLKVLEVIPKWVNPVNVVVLNNTADNGFPHTRPDIICIPHNLIDSYSLQSTLIHESVHILQRRYPKLWNDVYLKVLNMKESDVALPHELEVYVRYNPDTIYTRQYVWNNKWIAVPVYLRKDNPQLAHIRLHFYDINTQRWQAYPPIEWTKFFGEMNDSEQEHPHEMAAYCIQKYLDKKELKPYENELINQVRIYFPEINL
jgi:hypothetical protein